MPFPSKTWPTYLIDTFRAYRQVPSRHPIYRYYAPYDEMFYQFFNAADRLYKAPLPTSNGVFPYNRACFIVRDFRYRPVLVADVRDDTWTEKARAHLLADRHMRYHFDEMFAKCALPRFWGLSFLGTSLRVYTGDTATRKVEPAFTDHPGPLSSLPKDLLEGAWDIDVLSQEGFSKMEEIANDIKVSRTTLRSRECTSW